MDMLPPSEITLDPVTLELISDAMELARQVNDSRPLPDDVIANIQKELLDERVFNSNAIEGNTLTLRETRIVLRTGGITEVGRRRDATEALNLGKAIAKVAEMVPVCESWSDIDRFMDVHETLLTGVDDDSAGTIRSQRVMISGAKFQPPSPEEVVVLLRQFFAHLNTAIATDSEPVRLAAWVHWGIARIHPFEDGNGRLARLWQDLILFGNRLTAAVIRPSDRTEYYAALETADTGDFNPLTQLVTRSLSKTLQVSVNALRECDELKDWAVSLVGETSARVDEQRQLEYMRWRRQMELLQDAFERCAAQVTDASDGTVEVQVRAFGVLDQSTWETLRSGGTASMTTCFWANFRNGNERIQYCFFFGRHWLTDVDRDTPGIGTSTCLLVSEQRGDDRAVRLSEVPDCPLALREILVVDDRLARKRYDIDKAKDEYDLNVDPLQVARDFVQEVFLRRLT
jgi:Fic family protein